MRQQPGGNILGPMHGPEGSVGITVNTPAGPANIALPPSDAAGFGLALFSAGVLTALGQGQEPIGKPIETNIPLPVAGITPHGLTSTGGAHFAIEVVGGAQVHFQCSFAFTRELGQALVELADTEEGLRGPIN